MSESGAPILHRHQKVERGIELLPGGDRQERLGIGPIAQLVHGGDQRQPAGDVVIAQSSRPVFHVRFKVEDGVAVLGVARASHVGQALYQGLGFVHDQLGDHLVMQAVEDLAIAGKVAAIQQGNGELDVARVKPVALPQGARDRADLHAQIPHLLREAANRLLERTLAGAAVVEKEDIHIGMREEPAAAETAQGGQGEAGRAAFVGGNDLLPQPARDGFDQTGAFANGPAAVAGQVELLLNPRGLFAVEIPQLTAQ